MQTHATQEAAPSADEAILELIRLREMDRAERERVEAELKSEIASLWLRVAQLQRPSLWLRRLFS